MNYLLIIKNIIKIDLQLTSLQWLNGNVQLFCSLFVFGQIVGPNIRIRPNSDSHIFGTALVVADMFTQHLRCRWHLCCTIYHKVYIQLIYSNLNYQRLDSFVFA